MFFQQNNDTARKYGSRNLHNYLQTNYPTYEYQDYQHLMNNRAAKIQSLFIKNRYRTYTKPILKNRINARMIEEKKNLPKNSLTSYFVI